MSKLVNVDMMSPETGLVDEAANCIQRGGILVYPTETLYGIGADATNPAAIRKVIAAKQRPDDKPILVIVDSRESLHQLVARIPASAELLMEEFWPGPLTIVFDAAPSVAPELTQHNATIGIRIPSSNFCLQLLQRCGCPLTSTSANISGEAVKKTVAEIRAELGNVVDLYIDAGILPPSKPSTVVSVARETFQLIREGAISFERIKDVLHRVER